ncbi:hypothetical protein SAMN05444007_102415 [Cribrihabitans marinus]|uniref:Uncharacterized protein n=1 Tax=Cribrihabitans marinus TaxID=1227549 RepID=A0A1H6U0Z7_9RHOB|nr:hypothetical protein [Cribrihabitans marinus]GGH21485.1 hypothetical protein GCM10010973_06110 [Cribrihabitans marinus]SEI82070.1 hypothetical protein SAMN05444007_102415 [Cribrihabitans marinus]
MTAALFACQAVVAAETTPKQYWTAVDARASAVCPSAYRNFVDAVRSDPAGPVDTIGRNIELADDAEPRDVEPDVLRAERLQIVAWKNLFADSSVFWSRVEHGAADETVPLASVKRDARKLDAYSAVLGCLHPESETIEQTSYKDTEIVDAIADAECKQIYQMYSGYAAVVAAANDKAGLADALNGILTDTFGRCMEGAK